MGNTSPQKQKKIKNVLPQTAEEKKEMKKPHIVKPCPEMYHFNYIECASKLANSMSTVHVDFQKHSLSVMAHMRALSSPLKSSQPRNHSTSFVYANAVRMARFAIINTKNTSASNFDFPFTYYDNIRSYFKTIV
jgi:hypothetical protein